MTERQSEAAAIIAEVKAAKPAQIVMVPHPEHPEQDIQVLVGHNLEPQTVKELQDEFRTRPERLRGFAQLADIDSVIAHANRFKTPSSSIFAQPSEKSPSLVVIYDYPEPHAPTYKEHGVRYAFPLSEEWKAWTSIKGSFSQEWLAVFLEERIEDVIGPESVGDGTKAILAKSNSKIATPAKLLELSRGLDLNIRSKVVTKVNRDTGEKQLVFTEEHELNSAATVITPPNAFVIAIPVFAGGELYQLPVRLRYSHQNGSVTWFLSLLRVQQTFDAAFRSAAIRVAEQTELSVYFGTAEN